MRDGSIETDNGDASTERRAVSGRTELPPAHEDFSGDPGAFENAIDGQETKNGIAGIAARDTVIRLAGDVKIIASHTAEVNDFIRKNSNFSGFDRVVVTCVDRECHRM